jgi:hypothetical protein
MKDKFLSAGYLRHNLQKRITSNNELVPTIDHEASLEVSEESKSIGKVIRDATKPTLCGLGTNSVPELGYVIATGYPGTGVYLNRPLLIWTALVPPLFVLSKYVEYRNKNKKLEYVNWFLEKIDTIFSTMVFNLETLSAIGLYVLAKINDNEYVQGEISDYYDLLIYPGLFFISVLIVLSPLNFYSAMERKFSQKKLLSALFYLADIGTSFIEKTVKLEAVGRAVIKLLTVFNLGGIAPDEDPGKWFETEIIPSWIGSIATSVLITYVERRKKTIFLLGDREERKELFEFFLQLCTAFSINTFYWLNVREMYLDPDESKTEPGLIYFSAASNLTLLLLPLGILFYLTVSYFVSNIKSFKFKASLTQPLLEPHVSDEIPISSQSSEKDISVYSQSSEEEIASAETINLEDSQLAKTTTDKSCFSFLSNTWHSFFGKNLPRPRFEEVGYVNNLEM